ncbi:single-stranded DNA-binding protein [Bhargavaea ginsengi]|uniref:single-stranded DNA-binding protein n=1 Tax=Bhargavaea ginsengi TaxID=426757 RepID=UPI003C779C4E
MNSINLIGRLTKDIQLRYTNSGKAVANATLAVDRRFQKDKTDFINLVIWDKQAENLANYTGKGSRIGVNGRIETDSYEKDGQRVFKTEVVVENFTFLDSKNDSQGGQQQGGQYTQTQQPAYDNNDPFQPGGGPIEVTDSDLPF